MWNFKSLFLVEIALENQKPPSFSLNNCHHGPKIHPTQKKNDDPTSLLDSAKINLKFKKLKFLEIS
jgi:hypothetical protein